MTQAPCPTCESTVTLPEPVVANEIVECGQCRTELEVLTVDPPVLAEAPEIEEDWGE
jgi:alpha-aminoadipate carrier protein LysW